jgi:hypothetical protein
MQKGLMRRLVAETVMLLGFSSTIMGFAILLISAGGGSRVAAVPAALFVIAGAVLAFTAVKLRRSARYLFVAAFFLQIGFLLLLVASGALDSPLSRLWPCLSIFAGLALIPAGWHRYRQARVRFVVPALAFVTLGAAFLLFSFGLIPFSFKRFFLAWWPLLLLFAGLIVTLVSFAAGEDTEERGP